MPAPRNVTGDRRSLFSRVYDRIAEAVDRRIGWDHLPLPLGLLTLVGVRNVLRRRNLYDTRAEPTTDPPRARPWDHRYATWRTPDGSYNDLSDPAMGMAGTRFGRNVPLGRTVPEPGPAILTPSPRTVSRELLTREHFQPAPTLNVLAAAWLQFVVRDWVSHGPSPKEHPWRLKLSDDDPWPQHPMTIMRTRPDPTRPPDAAGPPTFVNTQSAWWDASQIYGSDEASQAAVRSGADGKLRIGADGRLELPSDPQLNPARVPGFWLGLLLMVTLFTKEHNAICDRLKADYPGWTDEELFNHARLVNAALIAKIHTVEWTPAMISHPTTRVAMRANWWGLLGERVNRTFGRLFDDEALSGIVGSETNHFGVPYSLTEEFVAVYRMHPLIPDDWTFRAHKDDTELERRRFRELTGPQAAEVADRLALGDLYYSFGTSHPGALRLHNFPQDLQSFTRPDGIAVDLAAIDILRARELGVPRYNAFRRLLHLKPASSFDTLTDDPACARQLERTYHGDVEMVDLMVGLFAEPLPEGFAFSDTAFRVFILMASRRLNSDRFFTRDYTPRVYTRAGIEWIDENDFTSVLIRHHPELAPALRTVSNGFAPWLRGESTPSR
jgi:hypothetical protein